MSEDALIVITSAIKTAFIDHPGSGHGTTWDQVTKSDEESTHLAKAVLVALRKAGYSVTKVEDQIPRSHNDEKHLPTSSGMPFAGAASACSCV